MESISRPPSLSELATERLRRAIMTGQLEVGERYSATELGEEIGVSRTPIREAAQELARIGMVEVERNRGIRILPTSIDSLLEGFEVRLMLEVPLARRAAMVRSEADIERLRECYERFREAAEAEDADATLHVDRDLHTLLLRIAGNARASRLLHDQRSMVLRTGVGTVPRSRTARECYEDHADLVRAVVDGDAEAAGRAMNRHILNTADLLIRQETAEDGEFAREGAIRRLDWLRE